MDVFRRRVTPRDTNRINEARIPADLVYGPPDTEESPEDDFVATQQATLHDAFELTREQLGKAASRRKHQYDLRQRPQPFAAGTRVWCLVPRLRPVRYQGPFIVTRTPGPVTYEIRKNPNSHPWTVHVDKLKPCAVPDPLLADPMIQTPEVDPEDCPVTARLRRAIRPPVRYRQ